MKKILLLMGLFVAVLGASGAWADQPGYTSQIFNSTFSKKLKIGMSLDQVAKLTGVPPMHTGGNEQSGSFGWTCLKDYSGLDVITQNGKIVDFVIHTASDRVIEIGKDPQQPPKLEGLVKVTFSQATAKTIHRGTPLETVRKLVGNTGYQLDVLGVGNNPDFPSYYWHGPDGSSLTASIDKQQRVFDMEIHDHKSRVWHTDEDGKLIPGGFALPCSNCRQ